MGRGGRDEAEGGVWGASEGDGGEGGDGVRGGAGREVETEGGDEGRRREAGG